MPEYFWRNTWKENQLLGESHTIKINLQWEQTRYISAMVYNVQCTKKSQMMKPANLFPLPQDRLFKIVSKSTPEQFKEFKEKAIAAGVNL